MRHVDNVEIVKILKRKKQLNESIELSSIKFKKNTGHT